MFPVHPLTTRGSRLVSHWVIRGQRPANSDCGVSPLCSLPATSMAKTDRNWDHIMFHVSLFAIALFVIAQKKSSQTHSKHWTPNDEQRINLNTTISKFTQERHDCGCGVLLPTFSKLFATMCCFRPLPSSLPFHSPSPMPPPPRMTFPCVRFSVCRCTSHETFKENLLLPNLSESPKTKKRM